MDPGRFGGYARKGDQDERDALARYVWNLELCGALYKPLQFLEIGLRRSIHNALSSATGRTDWFEDSAILKQKEREIIAKLRCDLERSGVIPTSERIVAGLTFGFWTSLFSSRYERQIFAPYGKKIFPSMPEEMSKRAAVAKRLENARKLRNLVFHHDPIWQLPDLHERHEQLLELITHINMPMRATLALVNNFYQAYDLGWEGVRARMDANLKAIEADATVVLLPRPDLARIPRR